MDIIVGADQAGARLDVVLKYHIPEISRVRLQKIIRAGGLSLDGKIEIEPGRKVLAGQKIELDVTLDECVIAPEEGHVEILWEDKYLAVCDKPAGLAVHPCASRPEDTLAQRLLNRFPQLAEQSGLRPGIVHRLDMDTTGILLVALTEEARLKLAAAFAARRVHKQYLALVHGTPPLHGECTEAIGRNQANKTRMAIVRENHGGKAAHTSWRRLWNSEDGAISLLALRIHTGRTHQIRVHMAHLGYPILGDKTYAPKKIADMAPRQMLHAWQLRLEHPFGGQELRFTSPPPTDFIKTAAENALSVPLVVITGNPGCGKSSFRKLLERQGLPAISADAIIADLYSRKSPVSDWLSIHDSACAINPDGSVDKSSLFAIFMKNPELRREFEKYAHSLTLDAIEAFRKKWQKSSSPAIVAEVPLYFECGWQKIIKPRPISVGVHCGLPTRWQRIRETRGWDDAKLNAIEKWQLPELKKMEACDMVIDNNGTEEDLEKAALDFIDYLQKRNAFAKDAFVSRIRDICASASSQN